MKIGLLFGSFNPIHTGHLIVANYFTNYVDKVWFIVSPQNPFKQNRDLLNQADRLQLVKLAVTDNEFFFVSDVEFNLPKPSYTINTLNLFSEKHPEIEFCLIIGSDIFLQLESWKSSKEIIENYTIFVYERPGFPLDQTPKKNIQFFHAPIIDISSTAIRNIIAENKSIRYLVPDVVYKEIKAKGYFQ